MSPMIWDITHNFDIVSSNFIFVTDFIPHPPLSGAASATGCKLHEAISVCADVITAIRVID